MEYNKNRFSEYSKFKQGIVIASFLFLLFVVAEVSAFLVISSLSYSGFIKKKLFNEYKSSFHPLLTKKLLPIPFVNILKQGNWHEYSPWFACKNNHELNTSVFATDKMGFISNGDLLRDLSKKAPGTYRIFILGGSTVAGVGIRLPDHSISAQLEVMLNLSSELGKNKPVFQIINAGVSGWYSAHEVAFAQFEILYYKPDMIINFDGVNDRMFADAEGLPKEKERTYWSPYHKRVKNVVENPIFQEKLFRHSWAKSKYNPARYFYSLHLMFYDIPNLLSNAFDSNKRKLAAKIEKLRTMYPKIPYRRWRAFTNRSIPDNWSDLAYDKNLPASSNVLLANRFINNLKNLSTICKENNIRYMAALQPILLPEFKKSFSRWERFNYDRKVQSFFHNYKKNYRLSALNYHMKCAELGKKELGDGIFFNLSNIFHTERRELYSDKCHYNKKGNKIIASIFKKLIESVL